MPALMLDRNSRNFTELYSDLYPLVYSVVYSKIGNADDAGDITQDVFTRYYEKMGGVENPRTWLLGAMRIEVLGYFRKKRGAAVNVDDLFEDVNLSFVNGFRDARLIIQESLEDMGNFVGEREKVLFDLIAVSNFTHLEAGQALGMSLGQVKYRYGLIVRRLIECLNRRGIRNLEDLI